MPLDVNQLSEVLSRDDDGTMSARNVLAYNRHVAEEIAACAELREKAILLRSESDIEAAAECYREMQGHLNHLHSMDAELRRNRNHSAARYDHQEFFGEVL